MNVKYTKRFLKDLAKIPSKQRAIIENLVFEKISILESLNKIPNTKKLSVNPYYRIRVGEYRIGLEKHSDHITLKRVMARKDIYKFFP